MPQLDVSTYASQIFWLLLTFVPLYYLLARKALPRIADVLESRQDYQDDLLEKAAELKNEAADVLAQYEAGLAESRSKAQQVVKKAADEMAAEAAKRHQAFGEELADRTQEAEARIAAARQEAVGNLRQVAIEVAGMATTKLTAAEANADSVAAAVDKIMAGGGKAG